MDSYFGTQREGMKCIPRLQLINHLKEGDNIKMDSTGISNEDVG
jgi:hypothetical protein